MKRGSHSGEPSPAKKPKTNAQITAKLLNGIQDALAKQLSAGKMALGPVRKALPAHKSPGSHPSNPEEYLESLEEGLKVLRASMDDQRVFNGLLSVRRGRRRGLSESRRRS